MAPSAVPLWSIGAVARMLDLSPATLRTWETRYGLVVPERSEGGQRLYSRAQFEQLRFVRDEVAAGRRPGEAHRLLAERPTLAEEPPRHCVLLVEGGSGVLAPLRHLLGTEAFEVVLASDATSGARKYRELAPALVVIDTSDRNLDSLAERLRAAGTKVLPVELLAGTLALLDRARALARPVTRPVGSQAPSDRVRTLNAHVQRPFAHRPARARHRPPAR